MQNFIPLGTGNSRSLKSAVPAGTTWEQALEMLRNGTFPIDLGKVNEPGVAQKGDPLNKETLYDDEVMTMFPGTKVPNEGFKAIRGPGAVTATYPVADGKTVELGEVADVIDGKLSSSYYEEAPSESQYGGYSLNSNKVFKLSDEYALLCGNAFNTGKLHGAVYEISSGKRVISGREIVPNSPTFDSYDVVPISNTRFLLVGGATNNGMGITVSLMQFSVSTNDIGAVKSIGIETSKQVRTARLCYLGNGKYLLMYTMINSNQYTPKLCIITLSGENLSSGTAKEVKTYSVALFYPNLVALSENQAVFIISANGVCEAFAISISGTTITVGNAATIRDRSVGSVNACYLSSNSICVVYNVAGTAYARRVYLFSSTTLSLNAERTLLAESITELSLTNNNGQICCFYVNNNLPNMVVIKMSSSGVLTVGTSYSVPVSGVTVMAASQDEGPRIDLTYTRQNQIYYSFLDTNRTPHIASLEILNEQFSGKFINVSKDVICLSSGTAGQMVEAIYAGIIKADWISKGQQIISGGVKGEGILDGILQVVGFNSPGVKVVSGSYVGTGKGGISTPTTLNFSSPPKIIFISSGGQPSSVTAPSYGIIINANSEFQNIGFSFGDGSNASAGGNIYARALHGEFKGTEVSYWGGSEYVQLNALNTVYTYYAIL